VNPLLEEAIAGEPVTVKLGGHEYRLSFPVAAVILYKKETAIIDRQRAKLREGAPLTRAEVREYRARWQKLIAEAHALAPTTVDGKVQPWNEQNLEQWQLLQEEANLLRTAVDENLGTGDSLYDRYTWRKISPDGDPERLVLALWVGLHTFEIDVPRRYIPQISREELGALVNLGNGADLAFKIVKAIGADILAAREPEEDTPLPNAQTPEIDKPAKGISAIPWKERTGTTKTS
jgi:hypothetical protein